MSASKNDIAITNTSWRTVSGGSDPVNFQAVDLTTMQGIAIAPPPTLPPSTHTSHPHPHKNTNEITNGCVVRDPYQNPYRISMVNNDRDRWRN